MPSLHGPLWLGVVVSVMVQSMDQIELFNHLTVCKQISDVNLLMFHRVFSSDDTHCCIAVYIYIYIYMNLFMPTYSSAYWILYLHIYFSIYVSSVYIYMYIRIYIQAETKSTIMTNEHTSLEKYTFHTLCERVMWERWFGDGTDCNILTPSSSGHRKTSSSFCWAAQPGSWGPKPSVWSWFSLSRTATRTPTNWLQLWLQLSVAPGHIIVCCPPASCGRWNCTEFNPSRWYPDIFDRMHMFLD